MKNLTLFLKQMTELALKFDIIVAESLESAEYTYDPKFGPKLYWDEAEQEYVFKMPDYTILTIDTEYVEE